MKRMPIVTFWNGTKEQCGSTSSSLAVATQMAIDHNMKILLVSTSLNDKLIRLSFWKEKKGGLASVFGSSTKNIIEKNGIEGLDRVIRSNKITPSIITDYTQIVLTGRLEVLPGMEDSGAQYDIIKERYAKIIEFANSYYDMVIVDLDKRLGANQEQILKMSDVVVAVIPQRREEIEKVLKKVQESTLIKQNRVVYELGKYIGSTKYNAKNISRNILKQKDIVNTIPYNSLFFESTQEGTVVDLFLNFMRINDRDENFTFVSEIKRLIETIQMKIKILQVT